VTGVRPATFGCVQGSGVPLVVVCVAGRFFLNNNNGSWVRSGVGVEREVMRSRYGP
jgi:hypothetical protein